MGGWKSVRRRWAERLARGVARACRHRVTKPVFVLARVVSIVCLLAMVVLGVGPAVILVGGWMLFSGSGIGVAGVMILAVAFLILLALDFVLFTALSVIKLAADCVAVASYHGKDIAQAIDGALEARGGGCRVGDGKAG